MFFTRSLHRCHVKHQLCHAYFFSFFLKISGCKCSGCLYDQIALTMLIIKNKVLGLPQESATRALHIHKKARHCDPTRVPTPTQGSRGGFWTSRGASGRQWVWALELFGAGGGVPIGVFSFPKRMPGDFGLLGETFPPVLVYLLPVFG